MTHNEALATLDLLQNASVVAVGTNTPPSSPAAGQCWIVGATPTGAWASHAGTLAGWTSGGWRFAGPREGMTVWSTADDCFASYVGAHWRIGEVLAAKLAIGGTQVVGAQAGAIAAPTGGATIDVEARAAVGALLAALRAHGLIAS